jgi:hypothetical protein
VGASTAVGSTAVDSMVVGSTAIDSTAIDSTAIGSTVVGSAVAYLSAQGSDIVILMGTMGIPTRITMDTPMGIPTGIKANMSSAALKLPENQGYQDGLKTSSDDARRSQSYDPKRSRYFKDVGFGKFAENYKESFSRDYSDGPGR